MNLTTAIDDGRILRVCDYILLKFPDSPTDFRYNISIKDRNGDTECDAFGPSLDLAFKECMNQGYELGKDEVPKREGVRKLRRTIYARPSNFREQGWVVQELQYVIERWAYKKYSLTVRLFEDDVPQIIIFAPSIDQLYADMFLLGYELVIRTSYEGKTNTRTWVTLDVF